MDIEEKIKIFLDKGWGINENGEIVNKRGISNGCLNKGGYVLITTNNNGKSMHVYAHQFIYYCSYGYVPKYIDHIDRCKNNNKIENLRETTSRDNILNTNRSDNSKCYTYNKKRNKYIIRKIFMFKDYYIGAVDKEEKAIKAGKYLQTLNTEKDILRYKSFFSKKYNKENVDLDSLRENSRLKKKEYRKSKV